MSSSSHGMGKNNEHNDGFSKISTHPTSYTTCQNRYMRTLSTLGMKRKTVFVGILIKR